jgi:hypothetical protein
MRECRQEFVLSTVRFAELFANGTLQRDIGVNANGSGRLSILVPLDDSPSIKHPDPRTIFMFEPMFGLIHRGRAVHVSLERYLDGWHIVRMNEALPCTHVRFDICQLVSEHVSPFPAELDLSALDSPIPEPELSRLKREFKASTISRNLLLSADAFAAILHGAD